MDWKIIIEIVAAIILLAFCGYLWYKNKNMDKALKALGIALPWFKEFAEKTDTKIDDTVLVYIGKLLGYTSPEKLKEATEKINKEVKSWKDV